MIFQKFKVGFISVTIFGKYICYLYFINGCQLVEVHQIDSLELFDEMDVKLVRFVQTVDALGVDDQTFLFNC